MAQSERRQALSNLRLNLNDRAKSVNTAMMTEFYKHPSQMNMSNAVFATLTNERIIQRNKCITAEYNKLVREEPYDDADLSANINAFFRSFELLNHNFPDTYNVSNGNGVSAKIELANKGIHYSWEEHPVYLKLTLKPDSGKLVPYSDGISDANFRQWFFVYQPGSENAFSINLLHEELNGLSRRNYYASFEVYEGTVDGGEWSGNSTKNVDGEVSEDSIKFNGEFAVRFAIIENGM